MVEEGAAPKFKPRKTLRNQKDIKLSARASRRGFSCRGLKEKVLSQLGLSEGEKKFIHAQRTHVPGLTNFCAKCSCEPEVRPAFLLSFFFLVWPPKQNKTSKEKQLV